MTNAPHRVDFSKKQKDYAMFLPAISEMYTRFVGKAEAKREPPSPLLRSDLDYLDPNTKLFYLPSSLYSAGQAAKSDKSAESLDDMVLQRNRDTSLIVGDSGGFQIETGAIRWEETAIKDKNGELVLGPIFDADGKTPKLDHNGKPVLGIQTKNDKTVKRMMNWLETHCDWSMILDFPTGSITRGKHNKIGFPTYIVDETGKVITQKVEKNGKKRNVPLIQYEKPINPDFCLKQTAKNNDYFLAHRTPGKTSFLNVIQGRSHSEIDWWYEQVKKYSDPVKYGSKEWIGSIKSMSPNPKSFDIEERAFEGWALAGAHKEDFGATMRRIIILRDDGLLSNKDWMHFLGMGKLRNGCLFTTIQREIRKDINPNFTISYDVSSSFSTAAYGNVITTYNLDKNAWSIQQDKMDGKEWIGSTEPLRSTPRIIDKMGNHLKSDKESILIDSPIAKYLTMGDLCVNGDDAEKTFTSTWDICSYAMMMNHNTYMYYAAYLEAQSLYDLPFEKAKDHVPMDILYMREIITEIFRAENPMDVISNNMRELRKISVDKKGLLATNEVENAELFGNVMDVGNSYTIAKVEDNINKQTNITKPKNDTFDDIFS